MSCPFSVGRPSPNGYRKHRYRDEDACATCMAENNAHWREYRGGGTRGRPRKQQPKPKPTLQEFLAGLQPELPRRIQRHLCAGYGCLTSVPKGVTLCYMCEGRGHKPPPWRGGPELRHCHAVVEQLDGELDQCGNLLVRDGMCEEHQHEVGVQQKGMPTPATLAGMDG